MESFLHYPHLLSVAAATGAIHTLMGPDHYIPFIAMARAGGWSLGKTLAITLACGIGHVAGSILLGAVGLAAGWAVGGLEAFESSRGTVAGWLLLGFGLAYTAWGLRCAWRNRPHTHWHVHGDGMVHCHGHDHHGDHAHVHAAGASQTGAGQPVPAATLTPWVLFTIFIFGPCEVLIPQLMYPAALGSVWGVVAVTGVFAVATLACMTAAVALGYCGMNRLPLAGLQRYAHAAAGGALTLCAAAIMLGL